MPKFKTKLGYCHVLPDKIVLSRTPELGDLSELAVKNNINQLLILYVLLASGLGFLAYKSWTNEDGLTMSIAIIFCVYFIIGVFSSLNNTTIPVIERSRIQRIKLTRGTWGLNRPYFVIYMEDDEGKPKKRLIMLPGSMSGGKEATAEALRIFAAENLMDTDEAD
ncbi:MAG: phosphoribosylaminoimidazolesuccinocarboxamide synthase [Bacteroidetes bacterium]|nr:phosphoribosylaminoimidazolesuccinocarboxamide synthase [Bacteroidota bacterium]